jgi:hypothetical protein
MGEFFSIGSSPRLEISEKLWNFGEAYEGDTVTHIFTLKNVGDTTLYIKKIEVSHLYVNATVSMDEIAGGSSASLQVSLSLWGKTGPLKEWVRIHSTDPHNPFVTLYIEGYLLPRKIPIVSPWPGVIELDTSSFGDTIDFSLIVYNMGEEKLLIRGIESPENILLEPETIEIPSKDSVRIYGKFIIKRKGEFSERFFILSNDPQKPKFPVVVKGFSR